MAVVIQDIKRKELRSGKLQEWLTWRVFWAVFLCFTNLSFFATVEDATLPEGSYHLSATETHHPLLLELIEYFSMSDEERNAKHLDFDKVPDQIEYVSEPSFGVAASLPEFATNLYRPYRVVNTCRITDTLTPPPQFSLSGILA